ncbi:MAG TPA: hypothetical protein VGE90_18310 [Chitinophaga sp.]
MKRFLNMKLSIFLLFLSVQSFGQGLSIKEQARKVISELKRSNDIPIDANDTLIDLNGDGFKDLLIEYYSANGTGIKNGIEAYVYDKSKKKLKPCEPLKYLANPTFYFNKKIVAGYYLGNGGGTATKLKWNGLQLDTLENIDIQVIHKGSTLSFNLTSVNYLTKRQSFKALKTMALPEEYKFMDYQPVIKENKR